MINRRAYILSSTACLALAACQHSTKPTKTNPVSFDIYDPRFADYISPSATAEILSEGHQWIEGPTWDKKRNTLYFTDVPQNTAYAWNSLDGVKVFLKPSGADLTADDGFREPGANGLLYLDDDTLLICNHGKRALERMDLSTGKRSILASQYEGKKFNSPNDVIYASSGDMFFTDPPYGLTGINDSPLKEMKFNGVYLRSKNGTIRRLLSDMTFPNGIVLSPDETFVFVSQSDPNKPIIRRVKLNHQNQVVGDEVWFDASSYQSDNSPGLPDGMVVAHDGALFTTGPGGVFVLSPDGEVLGRINTGKATANCTFGETGSTLFITAGDTLLKLPTLTHS
ncbi:SMP-30/gluconolactonase/LRE family protein [Hirschia litorea]|uniref:SMP-30/gluconolactonase/LRE family protein n=1 Tax=Hirschia litorea TaxID=1199156 RepID=A0ABW2IMV6_9PROT